jgi:hypothetical protein
MKSRGKEYLGSSTTIGPDALILHEKFRTSSCNGRLHVRSFSEGSRIKWSAGPLPRELPSFYPSLEPFGDTFTGLSMAPRPSIIRKAPRQCVVGKSAKCRPIDRASASSYEATDREELSVETRLLEFQSSLCGLATSLSAQARHPPIALIFIRCGEIARNTIDFQARN